MPLNNPKNDFSKWYDEVLLRAEIIDKRTPIKGANVLMSNGYEIWEKIKILLNKSLRATGHKFANFPLFILEEFLNREAEHFSGLNPEVAWVTHSGDTKLERKLALRPTSETIMYNTFAKWIHSHAELPMKYSQWCNIIRWDTNETRPLIRDREFLWNESHTVHQTREEAEKQIIESMEIYQQLFDTMALPSLVVRRPDYDKFAGADYTVAYDMPMPDGKVLQIATTHQLADHFSKVFDVTFLDQNGETKYAYQTSYGLTTRLIAAVISMHGDDDGLILPPKIAPIQICIIPIFYENSQDAVLNECNIVKDILETEGYNIIVDDRDQYTPGWKFSEWEMRGVPLRIEIGPRDIKNNNVVLVRRDTKTKHTIDRKELLLTVETKLDEIQNDLKQQADLILDNSIVEVTTEEELAKIFQSSRKIIVSSWCENMSCRDQLKDKYSIEIRGHHIGQEKNYSGNCLVCNQKNSLRVYFAQAY